MEIWIVELETDVWLAPWDGDPGRTLVRTAAKAFGSLGAARAGIASARKHRTFAGAYAVRDDGFPLRGSDVSLPAGS